MSGDFTLGCLLGQYDRAQSFDISSFAIEASGVNSWDKTSDQTSLFFTNSPSIFTHSSGQVLEIQANSSAALVPIRYNYGLDNDAYQRWFPDVTTHALQMDAWGRGIFSANSGTLEFRLAGNDGQLVAPIPNAPGLVNLRLITTVVSESVSRPTVFVEKDVTSGDNTVVIDDVLLQVDPIVVHPEYSFRDQSALIKEESRTLGGNLHTYVWDKFFAWNVPLQFISNSHMDLINWWWQNQFNLLFTLDTSDAETSYIVRITNDRQPINTIHSPYRDELWRGTLQLESITNGSLVF